MSASKYKLTLIKSMIGSNAKQRANLQALGLKKMHQSVTVVDSPEIMGMVRKVSHLLSQEKVS